ncbi:Acetyltransferase (GNAT) domain-containing protein [Nonomuraea solani]|uniref:Acetyltransferase (GNAT) domain-containing protein n=1 Tax=Nonomuraea solani TaxID=1144553 RepID=A0A1H6ET66_9ACTN|nr:GNAT family N-acetyltransferase [Nonomuraea solani]SEH01050.1 Acetyltransferase (GNAT) domain-containing protein [Nonomuraea solani]
MIHIADSIEDLTAADLAHWTATADAARAPAFYHPGFLRAYERAPLAPTDAFHYLFLPGAVLPAYLQGTDDAAGDVSGLGLAGDAPGARILLTHVTHCYDTVLPAYDIGTSLKPACRALAELAARHRARWFAFLDVDAASPLARHMTAGGFEPIPMETRYRLDLSPYRDLGDLIASHPRRSYAGRWLRRIRARTERGDIETTVLRPPFEPARIAEAVELCRRTTARHGTPGYYPEHLHAFVREAGPGVRVVETRIDGRLATAVICLTDAGRFHLWAGGTDEFPAGQGISRYTLLVSSVLGPALDAGARCLEAGRGNGGVKEHFRMEPVRLAGFVGTR